MKRTQLMIRDVSLDPAILKQKRLALKMTQQDVADAAELTQPLYADLENGKRKRPSLDTAVKLAKVFKCRVDDLLEK